MLSKFIEFVKRYQSDIILVIGVILISLISFAAGYLVAKDQLKEPIRIENPKDSIEKKAIQEEDSCIAYKGKKYCIELLE